MEELELKGETKPEDSVKETDILEEPSQENADHGYMNSSKYGSERVMN